MNAKRIAHMKKSYMKKYRAEHRNELLTYDKKYRTDHRQEILAYCRTYRAGHRISGATWDRVFRAIKSGKIVKPTICESCGNERCLEGHHSNYMKPLDVVWICRPCHSAKHLESGAIHD